MHTTKSRKKVFPRKNKRKKYKTEEKPEATEDKVGEGHMRSEGKTRLRHTRLMNVHRKSARKQTKTGSETGNQLS